MIVTEDKIEEVAKQTAKDTALSIGSIGVNTYTDRDRDREIVQLRFREPENPTTKSWLGCHSNIPSKYGVEIATDSKTSGKILQEVKKAIKEINNKYIRDSSVVISYKQRPFRAFVQYTGVHGLGPSTGPAITEVSCTNCDASVSENTGRVAGDYIDLFMMYALASCYQSCECDTNM